jgi:hypothetical protein
MVKGMLEIPGFEIPETGYVGKKTHQVRDDRLSVHDCFGNIHRYYHFYAGELYIWWNLKPGSPVELVLIEVPEKDWVELALEYDVKRFQGTFTDW